MASLPADEAEPSLVAWLHRASVAAFPRPASDQEGSGAWLPQSCGARQETAACHCCLAAGAVAYRQQVTLVCPPVVAYEPAAA